MNKTAVRPAKPRFMFPTDDRPDYYRRLGENYQRLCAARNGKIIAIMRSETDGSHPLKLKVRCADGHVFTIGRHLKDGKWCPSCREQEEAGRREAILKELRALAVKRGGRLLSKQYLNAREPMNWRCHLRHEWQASADNVKNKESWCPDCALQALWEGRDRAHRERSDLRRARDDRKLRASGRKR